MVSPEEWYKSLPPVTRTYFTIAGIVCVVCSLGMFNAAWLQLSFPLVFSKFQIWRLLTNFVFFGAFGIPWIIQMYILNRYLGLLETTVFEQSPRGMADLLFLMLFNGTVLILVAYLMPGLQMKFLGNALVISLMYVWTRTDPFRTLTIYGFEIKAWHFPFIMMAFTMLMGGGVAGHVVGILTGHLFFFLWRIVPNRYHKTVISTPEFMYNLCKAENNAARFDWQRDGGGRLN